MKKKIILASILTLLMIAVLPGLSSATIVVPSYGETGWQTYSHYFDDDWSGLVGIGVSDESDTQQPSYLLIDNFVNLGPAGNQGFEMGNFTGYTLNGTGSVVPSATSFWGTVFTPTEGSLMAMLDSDESDTGASTSFLNPWLLPTMSATDGSWIEFSVNALAGDTVFFDWNFFTTDYTPYQDFAFLYSKLPGAADLEHAEILAKIPEPSTLILLGAGLFGLGAYSRRKLRK